MYSYQQIIAILACFIFLSIVNVANAQNRTSGNIVYFQDDNTITNVVSYNTGKTTSYSAQMCQIFSPQLDYIATINPQLFDQILFTDLHTTQQQAVLWQSEWGTTCTRLPSNHGVGWLDNMIFAVTASQNSEQIYQINRDTGTVTGPFTITVESELPMYAPRRNISAYSPDRSYVVYRQCQETECANTPYVVYDIAQQETITELSGHGYVGGRVVSPNQLFSWSQSGRYIAYDSLNQGIAIYDVLNEQLLSLNFLPSAMANVIITRSLSWKWSPEETKVSFWVENATALGYTFEAGLAIVDIELQTITVIDVDQSLWARSSDSWGWSLTDNSLLIIKDDNSLFELNFLSGAQIPIANDVARINFWYGSSVQSTSCDMTISASDTISLISAVTTGNNAGSPYTICLEDSTYTFASSDNSGGYGANALPVITGDITIIGNGATIERDITAPDFRFFHVENGGSLTLENLTLQNGVTSGSGASGNGGAIHNRGTLNLVDATVINNTANVEGGAIYNDTNAVINITDSIISNNTAVADDGGAIDNHGSLVISGSTFEYNSSTNDDGGAIWNDSNATLSITDSILRYNTAFDFGGAIRNFGTVIINNSNIDNNTATQDGGAISSDTGVVTITNSSLNNNSAVNDDGGAIITFAPLTLNNVTLDGNNSGDRGGAIYAFGTDLIIENQTVFSNNSAGHNGGALYTGSGSSTLSITDSTFNSNTTAQHGGALYLDNGTHIISNTLFQSNTSVKRGGAIFTYGNLTINLNTIFDANQASDDGGAIYANDTITITDSTLRFNSATDQGGAVRGFVSNSSFLVNSCIHDNTAGNTSGLFFASSNFDASYNWWGATDGASGSGSGSGDAINNNVDYSNFITTACVDAFGANGMNTQSLAVAPSNTTVQSENVTASNTTNINTYPVVRTSYENNFDVDDAWFNTTRWQRDDLAGRTGGAWIIDTSIRGQASTLEMTTWVNLANNPQIRLAYADQAQLSSGDIITLEIQVQGSSDWVVLSQSIGSSYSWQDRNVSLSAYRGQTIRLRWRVDVSVDVPIGETSAYYAIDDLAITRR